MESDFGHRLQFIANMERIKSLNYELQEKRMESQICEFYNNKTVFVTGGTGFIGKVLIEKLLYSCSGLKTIYVLIRPKRGKNIHERIQDLLQLPLFSRIKREKPEVLDKLIPLDGNLMQSGLGLSTSDMMTLLTETNVIFHVAATVNMQVNLKEALETNVLGTQRILNVAKHMTNLQSIIYASTAFSGFDVADYDEKLYDWHQSINELLMKYENDQLNDVDIHPFTNNYAFSKRMTELLIDQEREKLPISIVRPSIVTPSHKEPFPGWIDSYGGVIGPVMAGAMGTSRVFLVDQSNQMEYIPVDIATNAIIIIGWLTEAQFNIEKPKLSIFNLTSSDKSQITYGRLLDLTIPTAKLFPFEKVLRTPKASATVNKFEYKMKTFLFEYIPFSIYDMAMKLAGCKGMNLRSLYQRQATMFGVLRPIMMQRFVFGSNRFQALRGFMSEADKSNFNVSTDNIDWNFYIKDVVLGARRYLLKQPDETLPKSRRNLKSIKKFEELFKIILAAVFIFTCYYFIQKINFRKILCSTWCDNHGGLCL